MLGRKKCIAVKPASSSSVDITDLKAQDLIGDLSFEDVDGMLQLLLLLSALTLSFAVPLLTSIGADDFIKANVYWAEHAKLTGEDRPADYGGNPDAPYMVSNEYAWKVSWSITMLVCSTFVACFLYVSTCFSNAREDPAYMEMWFVWGKWGVAIAMIFYFLGFFFTINATNQAVGILFPPEPNMPRYHRAWNIVALCTTVGSGVLLVLCIVIIGYFDLRTRRQYKQKNNKLHNDIATTVQLISYCQGDDLTNYQRKLAKGGLTDAVIISFLDTPSVEPSQVLQLLDSMLNECGVTKQGHRLLLLSAMLRLKDEEGGMLPVDTPVTE
jgi:hypothetical protein